MRNTLRFRHLATHWPLALLCLLWSAWPAGQALAQATDPTGGMLSPAATTVCANSNAGTLTLTGYTGRILRFEQSTGGGFVGIPNSATTSYSYSNLVQTTTFRAIVNNGNRQVASAEAVVTVNPPPTATVTATGPITFCERGILMLLAGPSSDATHSYGYQFLRNGVPIPGATAQAYRAAVMTSGSYSVQVTDATGCSAKSSTINVLVSPTIVLTLTPSGATTFCQGGSVGLKANVQGNPNSYSYQFLRNGVTIAGATTSTYTATTSGNYSVTVTNPNTCSSTAVAIPVTVVQPATVTLSYAAGSFCQTGPNPTPTASPAGGTFTAFPNGLSLNAATGVINVAASTPGSYRVTYSAGVPCPGTATFNVAIFAGPKADFNYPTTTSCAGTTGTITPTLAAGASTGSFTASPAGLSLDASTGVIDIGQSKAGTYTVTYTIAASGGCAAVAATTSITLNAPPTATLTAGGPTTFCAGGAVLLTASGGSSYQFLLNGTVISGATSATYSAKASGAYSVAVSSGSCSVTSAAITVTANPLSTPTLSYGMASYCQGAGTAAATVAGGNGGGSYAATPGGLSLSASTGAIDLGLSEPGSYTITYTDGGSCPGAATATVAVQAAPSATFSYAGGSTLCTSGSDAAATITGTAGGTFSALPAGLSINATTGAIAVASSTAGTYAVTYTVAGTCPGSSTITVTLTTAPVATFSYPASAGCAGSLGTVAPTFSGGGSAGTFVATPSGLSLNPATGVVSLSGSTGGTYTVTNTIAASGSCAASSATATLTLPAALAQPTLTLSGSTLTTPVVAGASYQFYLNGAALAGTSSNTLTATEAGSYTVVVTSAAGCASPVSAAVQYAGPITATRGSQAAFELTLFPNPTPNGLLTIGLAGPARATQLTVLNSLGQAVRSLALPAATTSAHLDLSGLATGVYVLRATTTDGTVTRRLLRE